MTTSEKQWVTLNPALMYDESSLQPMTVDFQRLLQRHAYSYDRARELLTALKQQPCVVAVYEDKIDFEVYYTFFVTGFTRQQVEAGELKAWFQEQGF